MGTNYAFYDGALLGMFILTAATLLGVSHVVAPYGRHFSNNWGPTLPSRLGWIVMESPPVWFGPLVFFSGQNSANFTSIVLIAIFELHYVQRAAIYPLRMKADGKRMPFLVAFLAFLFNVYNSYLQAFWIGHLASYPPDWLASPRFVIGSFIFLCGFCVNVWADSVLISLRKCSSDGSYKIPRGFLYEWVSCPNYLSEMVEWFGWALLTWSSSGFVFFLYTIANLAPRALQHHSWYRNKFDDYPEGRKALIPYLL
eukprot:TRINITY_DN14145_c0_g1_i1.p1 TRINITY_DN14145_c0_g1~~TRINITY_DN14145_c0_g1_i1.p1  ORF type:complete len:266 (+),score=16.19 TRINITY_DN14145_c0_g1_i1:35-799(+)